MKTDKLKVGIKLQSYDTAQDSWLLTEIIGINRDEIKLKDIDKLSDDYGSEWEEGISELNNTDWYRNLNQ